MTMTVQEAVELTEIQKENPSVPLLQRLRGGPKDLGIRELVIGVHAVRNVPLDHLVEDGAPTADPGRRIDVPLLDPVEPREQMWRHAHLEERPQPEQAAPHFFKQTPSDPVVEQPTWQKVKDAQPPERRADRVVVEEIPVTVVRRHTPGEDTGNRARAVAEHGSQRPSLWQQIGKEVELTDDRPPEGIDENEDLDRDWIAHLPEPSTRTPSLSGCHRRRMRLGRYSRPARVAGVMKLSQ